MTVKCITNVSTNISSDSHMLSSGAYWSLNRATITEDAGAQLRCYRKYKTMPLDKK